MNYEHKNETNVIEQTWEEYQIRIDMELHGQESTLTVTITISAD